MDYLHCIYIRLTLLRRSAAAKDKVWRAMQPHADVPFRVSGLEPPVFEAWTRTGLCDSSRSIDVIHPDRLMDLRSLVRMKPLISRDELVEEGNILDRNEKRMMAVKSNGPREAKHGPNQTREMVKEVQEAIETLKKRVERTDVPDKEFEDCQDMDRVMQATSPEVSTARVARSSPLSGVKVGPSVSTKLNYILAEVCLHTYIDDVGYFRHAHRSSNTLQKKSSSYSPILS